MYAIVRSGGRQHKVAVGDILEVDKTPEQRATVQLPTVLVVDGESVTCDPGALGKIYGDRRGGRCTTRARRSTSWEYKNKTGYRKRQGHRQALTKVKITGIDAVREGG